MWHRIKSIFGQAARDRTQARRRVFRVDDPALAKSLLDVARAESVLYTQSFRTLTSEKFGADLWRQQKDIIHKKLCAQTNWPDDVTMIARGENAYMGFSGPELVPGKDALYLTVPNGAYYKAHDVYRAGNQKVIDVCEDWTPPVGVTEVDPFKFGAAPVGVPRAKLPYERFEKLDRQNKTILAKQAQNFSPGSSGRL